MSKFISTISTLGLTAAVGTLTACSSATRTRYMEHTSVVLAPADATTDEIALAFGLDEFEPTVVAAVDASGQFAPSVR